MLRNFFIFILLLTVHNSEAQQAQSEYDLMIEKLEVHGPAVSPYQAKQIAGNLLSSNTLEFIYTDVNGWVDRWWRSKDWLTRDCIRAASLAKVQLVSKQLHLEGLLFQLDRLQEFVLSMKDPESIAKICSALGDSDSSTVYNTPAILSTDYRQLNDDLGSSMMDLWGVNEGDKYRTVQSWESNAADNYQLLLTEASRGYPTFASHLNSFRNVRESKTYAEIELVREKTLAWITAHRSLIDVQQYSIDQVNDLLASNLSAANIEEIYDSYTGIIDALWKIIITRGKPGESLEKEMQEVIESKAVEDVQYKIVRAYFDKGVTVGKTIYNESRIWLGSLGRHKEKSSEELEYPDLPPVNMPTAEIWLDFVDSGMLAVDITLITAGLAAAPATGGFSLLLTGGAFTHMVGDLVGRSFIVTGKHETLTEVVCLLQNSAVRLFVSQIDHGPYELAELPISKKISEVTPSLALPLPLDSTLAMPYVQPIVRSVVELILYDLNEELATQETVAGVKIGFSIDLPQPPLLEQLNIDYLKRCKQLIADLFKKVD